MTLFYQMFSSNLAVSRGPAVLGVVWPGVLVTLTQTRDPPGDLAVTTPGAAL